MGLAMNLYIGPLANSGQLSQQQLHSSSFLPPAYSLGLPSLRFFPSSIYTHMKGPPEHFFFLLHDEHFYLSASPHTTDALVH